jgi:hypothetical protein
MKKSISFFLVLLFLTILGRSQSVTISPAVNTVFCPETEYEFYVFITNASQINSIAGISDPVDAVITSAAYQINSGGGDLSFKFKARFRDENRNQAVLITYRLLGASQFNNYTFYFTGVKSFKYLHTGSIPQVAPLTLLRCQGQTLNLSSNSVGYYNLTNPNSPQFVGNESTFEYLLPGGWSIGSTTSNGSNWITANNNVNITTTSSDGPIEVRDANGCSTALLPGPETNVAISRPAPSLTVTGDNFLCSGSKPFSISGAVPPGTSFCWTSSNTNFASLGSPCGLPISLNYVSNGIIKLSATATDCLGSYAVINSKDVLIGNSVGGYYSITSNYHNSGNQLLLYNNNTPVFLPANQGFGINAYITSPGITGTGSWSRNTTSYPFYWYQIGSSTLTFSGNSASVAYQQRTGIFNLSVPTACGTFNGQFSWPIVTQGWSFMVVTSPNPGSSSLNVSIFDDQTINKKLETPASSTITIEISRFDNAKQIKTWKFKGNNSDFRLDVSELPNGTYILRVNIDGSIKSSQIIIHR